MIGFPKAEKPSSDFQYASNFLKSVVFQIKYPVNKSVVKNKEKLKALFKDDYPNHKTARQFGIGVEINKDQTPILQQSVNEETGSTFTSKEGNNTITITEDTFSFTVVGNAYSNFNNFLSQIDKFDSVFELCGIKELHRIAIRKTNIVEFQIANDTDNTSVVSMLDFLLNKVLANSFSFIPGSEFINQGITSTYFVNGENKLYLRYGLMGPMPDNNNRQIILDIDLFSTETNLKISGIKEKLTEINQEIFNIFSWSFTDEAKEHLKTNGKNEQSD